jgi:DNA-directed RNA polymerase specialized sigma24 family protein
LVELLGQYSKHHQLLKRLERLQRLRTRSTGRAPTRVPRTHKVAQRLQPQTLEQIVVDYEEGLSTAGIVARYGLGKGTVIGILRRAGVAIRNQGLAPADLGHAIELYEAGLSLKQVAARCNCDAETVRKELRAVGVRMRKPWERK